MKRIYSMLAILIFISGCIILFSGCDIFDTDENNDNVTTDEEDPMGNLVINNNSGERIVLYRGEERLKVIPNSVEDYLVDVDNPEGNAIDLRICKLNDVEDHIDNHLNEDIFKRWIVPLAEDNELEHRSTWYVSSDTDQTTTGSVTFEYLGGTDNYIEVHLNNQTGPKVSTLNPGQTKQFGFDYGIYTLHYNYKYSDPNSPGGFIDIGWRETEEVYNEEVSIWLVLNDIYPQEFKGIPHKDDPDIDINGAIRIYNKTSQWIRIYSGSQLIENVCTYDGNHDYLSIIAPNDNYIYIMEEGNYTFRAEDPNYQTISTLDTTIVAEEEIIWEIE